MRIGKKIKAVAVATLALLLAGCSCAGKNVYFSTGLSKNEVFKINGSPCKLSESMLFLTTEKNLYENSYGNEIWKKNIADMTFEEYVKNNVKSELAEMKTMTLLAKEKKIKLTEDEQQKTRQIAEKYYNGLSQREIEYMDIKQDTVEDVYHQYFLAKKVYSELTKEVNPEISDADAKIIKVQSIYAKTYVINHEGQRIEYTEEEKVRVKSDMEDLMEEINNGGDFTTIAANHTDAGQVEYQFGKGEMIAEFETAAFGMTVGQVSGIIDTPDGYYIIKCLSDYMEAETQVHKQQMIQEAKDKAFMEIYNPFIGDLTSEFNDELWDSIKFSDMNDIKVSNFYELME
ncbi:MAG: hypothetical protein HFI34_06245 [Lachnospiraceae bacterium]|nr:hypothetical protein [Lachnospiraceae bacterium]